MCVEYCDLLRFVVKANDLCQRLTFSTDFYYERQIIANHAPVRESGELINQIMINSISVYWCCTHHSSLKLNTRPPARASLFENFRLCIFDLAFKMFPFLAKMFAKIFTGDFKETTAISKWWNVK